MAKDDLLLGQVVGVFPHGEACKGNGKERAQLFRSQ